MKRFFNNPFAIMLILIMAYNAIVGGRLSNPMDWLMDTLYVLPGIVIGLAFHEFAHAFVAYRCGDDTPKLQGRVTLNPLAHIDPVGFIALIFIGFGWGKPVMINPNNFKKPRLHELLVSLAGVTMNLLLAVVFMGIWRLLFQVQPAFMMSEMGGIISSIMYYIVYINIVLMVFNLLPIPPLDGFGVLTQIFNLRETRLYYQIYDKGFLILMILILFNVTGRILSPAVGAVYGFLFQLFFF